MRRLTTVAALTLGMGMAVAVAASAQDSIRIRERSPERTFTYRFGPGSHMVMRRGRLGVTVDLRPDASRDSLGALVGGVTPGGPAERAGVQAGDIITRLNGARLVGGVSSDDDGSQSRPGMKLIELASHLEHGDTVRLDLLRENRPQTVTFTAAETDMDVMIDRMRIPGGGMSGTMRMFTPGGEPETWMQSMPRVRVMATPLGDIELIRVSPDLAAALGIAEGVLVANAGTDTSLGLRTGDVITTIGGRRPTSPAHAMRILSSYDGGENVQFEVMRRGRRVNVTGRLPQEREARWRISPNRFEGWEGLEGFEGWKGFDNFEFEMLPRWRELLDQFRDHERHLGPDQPMPRATFERFRGARV